MDQPQVYTNSYPQYDPNISYHGYDLSRDVSAYRFDADSSQSLAANGVESSLVTYRSSQERLFRIDPCRRLGKRVPTTSLPLNSWSRSTTEVNGQDVLTSSSQVWAMPSVSEPFGVFPICAIAMVEVKSRPMPVHRSTFLFPFQVFFSFLISFSSSSSAFHSSFWK